MEARIIQWFDYSFFPTTTLPHNDQRVFLTTLTKNLLILRFHFHSASDISICFIYQWWALIALFTFFKETVFCFLICLFFIIFLFLMFFGFGLGFPALAGVLPEMAEELADVRIRVLSTN